MADPSDVSSTFTYCDKRVPTLGLLENLSLEYRVYALELADNCVYVGIAHRSDIKRAIGRHFGVGGVKNKVHFTSVHSPKKVLLVWPAASTSVEAYVYYAFLGRLSGGASQESSIGGWVQTSSNLSPVAGMVVQEARRQLRSECFNCGSRTHYARECPAPLNGRRYPCECGRSILVTSRGQTPRAAASSGTQALPQSRSSAQQSHSKDPTTAAAPPPEPAKGRLASTAMPSEAKNKRRKVLDNTDARGGKELLVMKNAYTSLSWFLCSSNPTPKQVSQAKKQCSENALELQGCHTRALDAAGFAAVPPAKPKSLTGDRSRLSTTFVDTELEGVRIRRNDGKLKNRLSQVIFRVSDLRTAFG